VKKKNEREERKICAPKPAGGGGGGKKRAIAVSVGVEEAPQVRRSGCKRMGPREKSINVGNSHWWGLQPALRMRKNVMGVVALGTSEGRKRWQITEDVELCHAHIVKNGGATPPIKTRFAN